MLPWVLAFILAGILLLIGGVWYLVEGYSGMQGDISEWLDKTRP
jgi:hypothetical protein